MKTLRRVKADLSQYLAALRFLLMPHPTTKAIGVALFLVAVFVFICANDEIALKIRLKEDALRQILWYGSVAADQYVEPPIPAVILDLYTTETYNADAALYARRYQAYQLPENLALFCDLGAEIALIDIYLGPNTWLGKYLDSNAGQADMKKLEVSLACFKTVLLPVQKNLAGEVVFPIAGFEPLKQQGKLEYFSAGTINSLLYPPYPKYTDSNSEVRYPYAALALSQKFSSGRQLQPEHYPQQLLPLQFNYYPLVFNRVRWEEMALLKSSYQALLSESGGDKSIANMGIESIYQNLTTPANNPVALPKVVLVGVTHDSTDQHNMPYTLGGPIFLTQSKLKKIAPGAGSESQPTLEGAVSGAEPPVMHTPGVYAILSTANALVSGRYPSYPFYNWPIFSLLIFGVWCWLSIEWSRHLLTDGGRYLFSFFWLIGYISLYIISFFWDVYLPLFFPIFAILSCLLFATFLNRQEMLKHLVNNYQSQRQDFEDNTQDLLVERQQPLIITQAHHSLALQKEPLSILNAKIDILEFWVQMIGLFQWADYYYYQQLERPIAVEKWKARFNPDRVSLGQYLGAFCAFGKNYKSALDAQESFFPQFYFLLTGNSPKKKHTFEQTLDDIVTFRNIWKHEKAASTSISKQETAIAQANTYLEQLQTSLSFLEGYAIIQPLMIKQSLNQKHTWVCQFYKGTHCYLGEVQTEMMLSNNQLYLYNRFHQTRLHEYFLKLDPWITAGECASHQREELFIYKENKNKKCVYSGLTAECKPTFIRYLPENYPF